MIPSHFHLPAFARNFAKYLQENLIGRFYTDKRIDINVNGDHHTLSFEVYLDDQSDFEDIYIGRFSSQYVGNENVRKWFTIDSVLFEEPIHLIYKKGQRKDKHPEIPFP